MLVKSTVIGAIGWFTAAQFVKYTGLAEPTTKWPALSVYGASLVLGLCPIPVLKLINVESRQVFPVLSLATAAALILDGLATVLCPFLYTFQSTTPVEGLAAIAFGAGCGILGGYYVMLNGYPF